MGGARREGRRSRDMIGYPLLGVAYLSDRFGAFVEPIFFVASRSWWRSNCWNHGRRVTTVESRLTDRRRDRRGSLDEVDHLQLLRRAGHVRDAGGDEEQQRRGDQRDVETVGQRPVGGVDDLLDGPANCFRVAGLRLAYFGGV